MYLYDRRDRAVAQKAVDLLEQAIQLDAKFARAWAGKAHVHRALANFSGNTHEEYKKSMEAVNRALALDENLSDAHSALCENRFFYEWDFGGAELECKRAIELDPGSSLAHQIYSRNLMVLERFDESIAEIKTAIDLDPASLFSQRNFGIAYYYARRYPEAVTQFKRVVEMDSNFEATYPWLINTLKLQGKQAEALEWFMKWQEVRKADQETLQAFRSAYQKSGWRGVEVERVKRRASDTCSSTRSARRKVVSMWRPRNPLMQSSSLSIAPRLRGEMPRLILSFASAPSSPKLTVSVAVPALTTIFDTETFLIHSSSRVGDSG